jgi:hypothetical protein
LVIVSGGWEGLTLVDKVVEPLSLFGEEDATTFDEGKNYGDPGDLIRAARLVGDDSDA